MLRGMLSIELVVQLCAAFMSQIEGSSKPLIKTNDFAEENSVLILNLKQEKRKKTELYCHKDRIDLPC